MEAELRTMVNPVARSSPSGRVRYHVPQPLVNRLGPLTTDANVVQPTPNSDVIERLGPLQLPEVDPWRIEMEQEVDQSRWLLKQLRAPQPNIQGRHRLKGPRKQILQW